MPALGSGKKFHTGNAGFAMFASTRLAITGWSATMERMTHDTTNTSSNGWQEVIGGNRRLSGSITYNISEQDMHYGLTTATTNNSTTPANTNVLVYLREDDGPYLYGYAYLSSFAWNSGVNSLLGNTTSFESSDDWFLPTSWS